MIKGISTLRLARYLLIGTVLSVLVFFSISFLSYLADIDTFNPSASNVLDVDIGFPFTYYTEVFRKQSMIPRTSADMGLMLADCAITWLIVALPYLFYKIRKGKNQKSAVDILDQHAN